MGEGAHRVELRGGGWPGPIARANSFKFNSNDRVREEALDFTLYTFSELVFEHAAAILVLQGMKLQDFFPPDVTFKEKGTGIDLIYGPFVYLSGELSKVWDPPLRLKNAVFAAVRKTPENMKREELLAALLAAVQ